MEQSSLLSRQLRILTPAVIGRIPTVRNCHGTVSENGTTAVVGLVHRKEYGSGFSSQNTKKRLPTRVHKRHSSSF